MPDSPDYTLAEVVRALKDVRDDLREIVGKFDAYVLTAVYESQRDDIRRRLDEVESNQKWVVRTVGGLVVSAVAAAFGFVGWSG